eukprot:gene4269-7605_t
MEQENKWKERTNVLLKHLSPNLKKTSDLLSHIQITTKENIDTTVQKYKKTPDVLIQFSPLIKGKLKKSKVSYLSPTGPFTTETLQAGILLVASTRAEVRRAFINKLCEAAIEKSLLVYSIAPEGGTNVETNGVYKLSTHPTLSRRGILSALLRHGAHVLIFGVINTRDDIMSLLDAVYTGYHVVAEIYGENANDVLSRFL